MKIKSKKGRRNNYPIILVHGTLGFVDDQHVFLRSYWGYSFSVINADEEVYEADVGGISSIHDRACELYQQIKGIMKVEQAASKNKCGISEQVYGKDHVKDNHRDTFYKPRFLRKKNCDNNKTLAYPKGIEGWSETNKIHLVGHSLGGQTIRYLQHLLKIGYFDDEYKGVDRSNWIASINCIAAPFNGAPVINRLGYCQKAQSFTYNSWAIKLIKFKVIMENLLSSFCTGNQIREKIIRKSGEALELAIQYCIMYEVNTEHFGWNRQSGERLGSYISRVWHDDYLFKNNNNAFADMGFEKSMEMNDLCSPLDKSYYFSYTTGIDEKVSNNVTPAELNNGIKEFTDNALGFDIGSVNHLKWQDIPREKGDATLLERLITGAKQGIDPIFYSFSYYLRHQKFDLPKQYEEQSDDVNWDAVKFDDKRWHEDNDTLLARITQEFPRISHKFNKLSSSETPWGAMTPQRFNWEDDSKLTQFTKGRWFYTNIENSNHLDYCGWPAVKVIKHLRLLFGTENRYEFSRNLLERLYSLEF